MLELMAGAGSAEAVIAAVQSAADSIFIRIGGARSGALTEAALAKAVRYCRVRGCRVYAMLDTLVADNEAAAAAGLARRASELGVDALIAQDLGFIRIARAVEPDLPVFAGTRLGLHNAAGIEAARQLGVSRVFLPPELSLEEIAALAARSDVELAAAVQTQLCPARAGQCWLSAVLGEGSANRGNCSGPCSRRFSLGGRMDDRPLAQKDALLLEHLGRLEAAGVTAVSVGGGTERPEQLAKLVEVFSACIREGRGPSGAETDALDEIFARRAHTDAYLAGRPEDTAAGEQLPDRDAGRTAERAMAAERRGYGKRELRRVRVEFFAAAKPGRPLLAGVQDSDGNRAEYTGPVAGELPGVELTDKTVSEELARTKGTPYHCDRVLSFILPGCRVPPDAVAEARRSLVHSLSALRAQPPKRAHAALPRPEHGAAAPAERLAVCVETLSARQLSDELLELKPDWLYIPLEQVAAAAPQLERFAAAGVGVAAVLPRVIEDSELEETGRLLGAARNAGVSDALVGNLGHIALARLAGMAVRGDYGLNIFNSYALEAAAEAGLSSVTASFELRLEQMKGLSGAAELEIIGYGRLPVMLTERCIIKASARRCVCENGVKLSDEFGRAMPVLREYVCRNAVYGPDKVFMADRAEELRRSGAARMRLMFTNEGARECAAVTRACMGLSDYRPNGLTRGFYYKGVE